MGITLKRDPRRLKTQISKSGILSKKRHLESSYQRAFIEWATLAPLVYKNCTMGRVKDYLFAIPNGGGRSIVEAKILKAEGVTAGVSDLFFAFPTDLHHGLWIEFKTESKSSNLTAKQKEFLDKMENRGYEVAVVRSLAEAIAVINIYLTKNDTEYLTFVPGFIESSHMTNLIQ